MRDRGTFNFSGNLEVKKDAPLEARSLVNSYADLVKPETWTDEQGGIWKYDCMLVSCKDRPGEVYQLQPGADYTKQSSWILIGDTSELNSKVQQFINSKGAPNGLASLNESGIIPSAQLPSYVDDVIEVDTFSNLPGTGESGKIYIVQDTNLTYRWSGTDYVEISKSLALGETSSTAYPGDKGKATTDKLNRIPDKLITDTVNVNQSTTEAVLNFTTYRQEAQQVGRNTLTITSATISQAGLMSSSDKTKLDGLKDQAGITSDIDAVQTNLETHINNKSNPHEVTKDQVGLGNVDNTSDANKPISTATQTALNGKFSATDGNALKQRVDNIPELIATDITVDSDNDSVNISLDKTSIVDGTLSGTTININSATASKAGILVPTDKSKIDKIITNGNGTKYLSDNGTYKEVQGGSADIESLKQYVNDSISSARSVGYMMQLTEIDASGLDENTWYPVTIAAGERMNIRVEVLVSLDSGTKPSWSTHGRGFSVRKIWEFAPNAWGVNRDSNITIYLSDFIHADIDPVRGLGNLSHFDTCYVFVRGGGKYHFYASHEAKVILHTDTYAPGDQSVSPTTTTPKPINAFLATSWNNLPDVLTEGNEFNIADNNINSSYFWINYRPRSGSTTNAKNIYVGNGQGSGGFGEVHASGFFKESDIRLKSNIVPLNHTLEQICNIPTVSFDIRNKHQIGTIAQDIENDFVDIVDTDSDGMKSVDYCMLGVVAVEGIKLLKQEIEDLKKQVEELKNGR